MRPSVPAQDVCVDVADRISDVRGTRVDGGQTEESR